MESGLGFAPNLLTGEVYYGVTQLWGSGVNVYLLGPEEKVEKNSG